MGFFRWMTGMPLAAAITVGLFLMMAALIKKEPAIGDPPPTPDLNIVSKPEPLEPPPTGPELTEPAPPPPDRTWKPPSDDGPGAVGPAPDPIGPITFDLPKGGGTVIQIPPAYPDACRSKGVEGVVLVRFDVTDRGETTNVQIVSSPDRCFDRDVIRAVRGWRYPAEARRGVTASVNFVFSE